ncbi:MAG TPA: AIR synthase-related protein [Candidatus Saccharimonadales bacterium]|nr:AIR synthase-related protein [Candidatus Saccharimonadales bacterium]
MSGEIKGEYALAGVDYSILQGFKDLMVEMGKKTLNFPNFRGVYVQNIRHSHGVVFDYLGPRKHRWCNTTEGLGNKNWIAEWMYQYAGTGRTYYEGIGIDMLLMAVNDVIAQGAMPAVYTDEVAAGDGEWFLDEHRARDFADSLLNGLMADGIALPAGETPALKHLINSTPPVISAPSLSGTITGIIAPRSRLITGEELQPGDHILGVASSGIHANGISLVIKRALDLPDQFLTKLPNGQMLGEEALIPTTSYVHLVEALLDEAVQIHALLPGTGDGIAKLAFDKRPFTYRVHSWVQEIPPLFLFMQELGVSLIDCLTTFNWGIGYYIFLPENEVERAIQIGTNAGYEILEVGRVEEGERQTIFEPAGLTLPPPGD